MTPYQRTKSILSGLDEMLSNYKPSSSRLASMKITNTIRWLHSNIKLETVYQIIDYEQFEFGDVILHLLEEKQFNPNIYN